MSSCFNKKITIGLLRTRQNNKINKGYTLIELLVVMLILGILSVISLPNFIGQVGKARETDAKYNLGNIARAQQAYHFEKQIFADDLDKLNAPSGFNSSYYDFPNPTIANTTLAKHQAVATNPIFDQVRNFAVGVYFDAGQFEFFLCQSKDVNETVDVPNTASGFCTNNGIQLK